MSVEAPVAPAQETPKQETAIVTILGVDVERPAPFYFAINGTYLTVEGKLLLLHRVLVALGHAPHDYQTKTTWLPNTPQDIVACVVHLTLPWGEYEGSAATRLGGTDIAGGSPYEVAETSALGRAIGFAGIDVNGKIDSANGIAKAGYANGYTQAVQQQQGQQAGGGGGGGGNYAPPPPPNDGGTGYICAEPGCGVAVVGYTTRANRRYDAAAVARFSIKDTGRILCPDHRAQYKVGS